MRWKCILLFSSSHTRFSTLRTESPSIFLDKSGLSTKDRSDSASRVALLGRLDLLNASSTNWAFKFSSVVGGMIILFRSSLYKQFSNTIFQIRQFDALKILFWGMGEEVGLEP